MPIVIVDNFDVNVAKNMDSRYGPYATTGQAIAAISSIFRYKGLTVLITGSGQNIEYWFNPTTADGDLVPKGASFDTSSLVTTSSFNTWIGSGTFGGTASLAVVTASLSGNDLIFTKGNGSQFTLVIPGVGGPGGEGIALELSGNDLLLTSASSTLSTVTIYPAPLALTASFVTASNVWGPFGTSSVQSASYASSSTYALTASYISGNVQLSAGGSDTQIQFNSSSVFSGSTNLTYNYINNVLRYTGSFIVSGAISSSYGPNTVGFYGTASWAESASQAISSSFITASNVWGPFGTSSIQSASYASGSTSASYALSSSFALLSSHSFTSSLAFTASFITASNVWGPFGTSSIQSASYASSSTYALTASYISGNIQATPGGSHGHIQFNSASVFSGSSTFYISTGDGPSAIPEVYDHVHLDRTWLTITDSSNQPVLQIDGTLLLSSSGVGSIDWGTRRMYDAIGSASIDYNLRQAYYPGNQSVSPSIAIDWGTADQVRLSGSIYTPNLTNASQINAVVIDTASGQLYYLPTSSFGGGGSGTPTPPGGSDTQIQFNSGSGFSGSTNFIFDYVNSIVQLTGSLVVSNSLQSIGSALFTGSIAVTGSANINGALYFGTNLAQAAYTTARIVTINGTNTVYAAQTASYDGAFFDYTLRSGSNARAGQIMSIWSGSSVNYTETTTTDIGSTSDFAFSVVLSGGSYVLRCTTTSADGIIKAIIKSI